MSHYLPYSVEVDGRWGPDHMLFGRLGAVRFYCKKAIQNGAEYIVIRHQGHRLWEWDVLRPPGCRWHQFPASPLAGLGEGASSIHLVMQEDLHDRARWTDKRLDMWCMTIPLILCASLLPGWPDADYPRPSGPHRDEDYADVLGWRAYVQASSDLRMWLLLATWSIDSLFVEYAKRRGKAHAGEARVRWLLHNAVHTGLLTPWLPLADESQSIPVIH